MPGASGSSPTSCSTTPPTRTPGSRRPVRTRTARTATSTSGATPTPGTPGCGSSSATPSTPTGPWTRCASSTSGTGSSPTSRLDAITYLYKRKGTNCANLPETHAYLKRLRKVVDDEYPGRVLLAEANLWPADLVDYFGDPSTAGDECHMAFHFPLMPRIFMAVRKQSRYPISEIIAQTPEIPSSCQWGTFLRNHDELTLEMGTDRNQMELFTSLLLSLPGSPVLYYGDEIGMGDNVWLGDRNSVRTPMQWSPDRNGGFSRCDPGALYLPVNMGPVYGYQAVNVERQLGQPASFLQWTKTMIEVRKRHPALALGTFTDLGGSNPAVLSFLREHEDETVLCAQGADARVRVQCGRDRAGRVRVDGGTADRVLRVPALLRAGRARRVGEVARLAGEGTPGHARRAARRAGRADRRAGRADRRLAHRAPAAGRRRRRAAGRARRARRRHRRPVAGARAGGSVDTGGRLPASRVAASGVRPQRPGRVLRRLARRQGPVPGGARSARPGR